MSVTTEREGPEGRVLVVTIDRPEVRNAVDRPTADRLQRVFTEFAADPDLAAAVLTGADGTFCAGADLAAIAEQDGVRVNRIEPGADGPMGPTRLLLDKPVIAAVEGHAVAGGLELALWCDLRVAAEDAVLGVFCRRWGVPLIDGGTVRLPRLIGLSRALDLILTGRAVHADEALSIGLINRVVPTGATRAAAVALAETISGFPLNAMTSDRRSAYEGLDLPLEEALQHEHQLGARTIASGETQVGAARFAGGAGRHGSFD
jgi:enoyl-CoA hydratase